MRHSAESSSTNQIELLREIESIFKPGLAHESGDPGVPFEEKNQRPKISWDCPFKRTKIKKYLVVYPRSASCWDQTCLRAWGPSSLKLIAMTTFANQNWHVPCAWIFIALNSPILDKTRMLKTRICPELGQLNWKSYKGKFSDILNKLFSVQLLVFIAF
jgi:hypothetical protein